MKHLDHLLTTNMTYRSRNVTEILLISAWAKTCFIWLTSMLQSEHSNARTWARSTIRHLRTYC